jgi:hypothetical protein
MPQLGTSQLGNTQVGSVPSSGSTDAVQTIADLLDASTQWSLPDPEVYLLQEISQQQRENNPNPAIYVWSPVDGSLDQFDAEYSHIDETRTVECQIWNLDGIEAETYHQEVIDLLSQYANDNYRNTEFHHIRPTSATDSRSDHIRQLTDHYILSVQAEVHNHRGV